MIWWCWGNHLIESLFRQGSYDGLWLVAKPTEIIESCHVIPLFHQVLRNLSFFTRLQYLVWGGGRPYPNLNPEVSPKHFTELGWLYCFWKLWGKVFKTTKSVEEERRVQNKAKHCPDWNALKLQASTLEAIARCLSSEACFSLVRGISGD